MADEQRDLYETDPEYIRAWQAWASAQHQPREQEGVTEQDTEDLIVRWRAYVAQMPSDWRRYSGQYIEDAIRHGTLNQYPFPPDFESDPL